MVQMTVQTLSEGLIRDLLASGAEEDIRRDLGFITTVLMNNSDDVLAKYFEMVLTLLD